MTTLLSRRIRVGKSFPVYRQHDVKDCGPTCLRMVAKYHGRRFSLQHLRDRSYIDRQGVSLLGIAYAAESIGFRTRCAKVSVDHFLRHAPLPCIVHWRQNHFVVVHDVTDGKVRIADPAQGEAILTVDEFRRAWSSTSLKGNEAGIVLLLQPTPEFFSRPDQEPTQRKQLGFMFGYLRGFGPFFRQVVLGMFVASVLQLIFPFLTQSIVDNGIATQNLSFINAVLIAQLALFFGQTVVEFIRNRILFHVGTRVYVSVISDFLIKLMKLPIPFFDTRTVGDILQRIQDHTRIQQFITASTLNVVFSFFTLLVFSGVLVLYSPLLAGVFMVGSALHVAWVLSFLGRRKRLDYLRFSEMSANQSALVELVQGMQEIKLSNAEQQRRWGWERVQARLFKVNLRSLSLSQTEEAGASFINQLKNITLTFLAAKMVIEGDLTLGMLLSVQFIVGQLNTPLAQLISFAQAAQDAKISLDRLGEIHQHENEEDPEQKVLALPESRTLALRNVSFHYGGPLSELVLDNVDLDIPEGKVTAIVGTSGSGKTTLLKILLKFYDPLKGEILMGHTPLRNLSARALRLRCGVVMQDGHIFADSVANNIVAGDDEIDRARLLYAARMADIDEFIESLPMGYNTRIGREGIGMSAGQKQRVLIARAIYKNPDFLFFDEATSSLDANTERRIVDNLQEFFRGRTVVVIAHRLSTVKNADQIVVLEKGRITERGTHAELTARRGSYFELVKNQLELEKLMELENGKDAGPGAGGPSPEAPEVLTATNDRGERVQLPREVVEALRNAKGAGPVEIARPDGSRVTYQVPGRAAPAAAAGLPGVPDGAPADGSMMYRRTTADRYAAVAAASPPPAEAAPDGLATGEMDDAIAAAALRALQPEGAAPGARVRQTVVMPAAPVPLSATAPAPSAEPAAAPEPPPGAPPPAVEAAPAPLAEAPRPVLVTPPPAKAPAPDPEPAAAASPYAEVPAPPAAESPSAEVAAAAPPAAPSHSPSEEVPGAEPSSEAGGGMGVEDASAQTSMDRADAANTEFRSEEIDEILTSMPGGLLRWGSTAVFVTIAVLLAITSYIRYPDVVTGRVSLTTRTPPVRVVSHASGEVARVFVADRAPVRAGDPLLLLKSPVSYEDVTALSAALDRIEPALQRAGPLPDVSFGHALELGDLQNAYSAFQQALSDYRTLLADPFYAQKVAALQTQIGNLEQLRERLKAQQQLLDEQLALSDRNRARSRQLGTQQLSSSAEVDQAEQAYLQQRFAGENGRTAVTNNEIQLAAQRASLLDLQQRRADDGERHLVALRNAQRSLRAAIAAWEQSYLPRSPVSGTASLFRDLHENQFVAAQEPLVAVLPAEGSVIGRLTLTGMGAGKVRVGQRAILHLENFPYREYGSVEGRVTRISQLGFEDPKGGAAQAFGYQAEVTLPKGLTTTYNRRLQFSQEMRGEVQVVTEDVSLLERVFNQIRSLREVH